MLSGKGCKELFETLQDASSWAFTHSDISNLLSSWKRKGTKHSAGNHWVPQWDTSRSRREHKQETISLLQLLLPPCYFDSISSSIVKTQPPVTHSGTSQRHRASGNYPLVLLKPCSCALFKCVLSTMCWFSFGKKRAVELWDQNSISPFSVRMGYSLFLRAEMLRRTCYGKYRFRALLNSLSDITANSLTSQKLSQKTSPRDMLLKDS